MPSIDDCLGVGSDVDYNIQSLQGPVTNCFLSRISIQKLLRCIRLRTLVTIFERGNGFCRMPMDTVSFCKPFAAASFDTAEGRPAWEIAVDQQLIGSPC